MNSVQVSATSTRSDNAVVSAIARIAPSPAAPCARVSMRIDLPIFTSLQREIRRDHMDPLARQQWQQQMKVRARALRARLREKR